MSDFTPENDQRGEVQVTSVGDAGFPTFKCSRPVTAEDVRALDDESESSPRCPRG